MTDSTNTPGADINRFELLGFVGRLRAAATPSGREVANFSVATHRLMREPESRQLIERTEWHDVVAFDELAAQVRQSVQKGSRIRVSGYLRTRSWIDRRTQEKQFKRELVALELAVLVPRSAVGTSDSETTESRAAGVKISSF